MQYYYKNEIVYSPRYLTVNFKPPSTQVTKGPQPVPKVPSKEVFKAQIEDTLDLSSYICEELHLSEDRCSQMMRGDLNVAAASAAPDT